MTIISDEVLSDLENLDNLPDNEKIQALAKGFTGLSAGVAELTELIKSLNGRTKGTINNSDDGNPSGKRGGMAPKPKGETDYDDEEEEDDDDDDDDDDGGDYEEDDDGDDQGGEFGKSYYPGAAPLRREYSDPNSANVSADDLFAMIRRATSSNNKRLLKSFTDQIDHKIDMMRDTVNDLEEASVLLHTDVIASQKGSEDTSNMLKSLLDNVGQRPRADGRSAGSYKTIERTTSDGAKTQITVPRGKQLLLKAMMAGRLDQHQSVELQYDLQRSGQWTDAMAEATEGL